MQILLTYSLLLITIAGAVVLRLRWPRLSLRLRRVLIATGLLLLVPSLLSQITKWDVVSPGLRGSEAWVRIVACQLILVFLTLLRPRWLTVTTAVVLLPLSFATSVAGPLSGTLRGARFTDRLIAGGYYLETVPWESVSGANSGVDFELFYKKTQDAVLRREIIGTRLYNTQCTTAGTFAELQPPHHLIDVHCPPLPVGAPDAAESGTNLRYWIPVEAQSPELLSYPQHGPGPGRLVRVLHRLATVIRSKRW